ncbi:hypothetical protein [Paenibacillus alginolyticus]|nr:hypothetical protein [Paenibacillus alginolyticus]MEC0146247.1 hypothetical protein [Paenibacillus alginolyticus]
MAENLHISRLCVHDLPSGLSTGIRHYGTIGINRQDLQEKQSRQQDREG